MTDLTHKEVEDMIDELRREQREFRAFIRGYLHGFQDCEADFSFDDRNEFAKRVKKLHRENQQ